MAERIELQIFNMRQVVNDGRRRSAHLGHQCASLFQAQRFKRAKRRLVEDIQKGADVRLNIWSVQKVISWGAIGRNFMKESELGVHRQRVN